MRSLGPCVNASTIWSGMYRGPSASRIVSMKAVVIGSIESNSVPSMSKMTARMRRAMAHGVYGQRHHTRVRMSPV